MKTVILTHADCDGICSASIAKAKFHDAEVFFTKPVSFLSDLEQTNADRIIIADIAITRRDAQKIAELLKIKSRKTEISYFDHHVIPDVISEGEISSCVEYVHRLNVSASELIYRHYMKDIPRERVWIALYGAIGDYEDDTPFARERIQNWDKRALYFEVSTLILGIKNRQFATYDAKRDIVETMALGKNPSDVPGLVRSAKLAVTREFDLYEYVKEHAEKMGKIGVIMDLPHFGFRGPAALFAATVGNTEIGMIINERGDHIDITARKRNSKIELNKMMEEAADAVGGSGGGHPGAAGARIPRGALDKFMHQVNKYVE
jgi:single-stranded-DNA-specific exonuclease